MAVISVQSPTTGVTYSVQIGGDTPTPTEQERINQYIAQQDAAVQGMMGGQSSSGAGEDTSWRGAVSYGLDQPLENIAITSNLLGGEGFGSFLSNLTDAPQGYQSATESFMEEDGFLSKLSYLPRAAVEQTGQFVGSVASRLAGSVLGGALGSAVAPGPGTVTGAGIGAFVGPAIFEGVQVLGPVALERARNNGRDVPNAEDWAGAFGTAAASGALNAIAPGLSGFFKKVAVEAGTEAVQSIVQQSGGSVATEAGLQVDPYQAVQEGILGGAGAAIITAPSAILGRKKEAAEDVLDKIDADLLEDEPEILAQISRGIIAEEGVPEQPATNDYAEQFRAFVPQKALGLPAPQAGSMAEIAGAGQPNITPAQTPAIGQAIGAEVPSVEVSPFRWSQYEAAKQSIIESGDATVPNIARAASSSGQPVTPAVAKKIRSQLEQDGVITSDPKAKGKYRATPESVKPVAMDESLRRSISDVTRDLEEARAARAKAEQDARRAAESGKKAEATVASRALSAADSMVKTSEATLNDLMVRLARAPAASTVPTTERPASRRVGMDAVIPAAQEPTAAVGAVAAQADIQTKEGRDAAVAARAGRLTQAAENYTAQAQQKIAAASSIEAKGRKVQLPKSEADRIASLRAEAARDMDEAKKLRSAAERASSDVQKMRERQAAEAARQVAATAAKSNRTPEYDARQAQLTNAMRQRLDGLGLKDVDVRGAPILEIEEARKGVLVEGMFDVGDGKRVISLSMGIYEPGASEADTLKKIAAVVDHEVIHALRNLGVIKDAEWKSLSSLAARQKYMREKDGKTVERQYTYLQRAERMNADADPEVQVEEAVAEMYRDFAAGRLKIGGRPRSVMERIRDFFRAIIRSHKDVGITDPAAMFEAIKSGQIGARERAAPEAALEPDADVDTVVPAETKPAARPSPQQKPQQTPEQQTKTKTQYEKTLEGSGAVERTLEKIGAVPIPYDTRLWDAESGTATYASGTSRVIDVGGRKVVIMNINGKRVPFYLSTGLGGKASVAPGKWYPFFGVSDSGWINKGSQQQINDFYGSNELRRAAEALNSEIGNIIRDDTIPKARLKGRHIDAINAGMSPVENGQPDTLSRFEENVRSVIAEISGSKKRMSRVSAATAKDRADYQSWATGPNGERAITDANGNPVVFYHGTSKDKDFTSFNVSKHGAWFIADPAVASQYAEENDSMTLRQVGWNYERINTASRVIPAFLRAANPFRGKMPDFVYAQNYKKSQSDWFDSLRRDGYDAWIPSDQPGLAVILSGPENIKSAYASGADGKKDMRRFSARTAQGIDRDGRDEDVRAAGPSVPASGAGAGRSAAEAAAEKFAARAEDGNPEYGQLTPADLDNITPEFFSRPGWAILTATEQGLTPRFAEEQNRRSHENMKADFARLGIPYREVMGVYKGEPDGISYIILADEPTARRFAATYRQESILTNRGLVYTAPVPRVALTGETFYGEEALGQEFYSQMGDETFSLGLDWSTGPTSPDIGPGYFERDDRPQLPIRRSDGMVELHHWSNNLIPDVDPAFAGTGPVKGTERVRGVKFGYFGINPRPDVRAQGTGYVKERGLGPVEHVALVDPDTLYPYFTDPDGLLVGIDESSPDRQTLYERKIKGAGYAGFYTERLSLSGAPHGNAAAMFDIVPVRPVAEVQLGLRNPTRYSRRSAVSSPLTEADKRLTVINRMDQETGAFISDGKRRSVMDVITELFEPRRDVVINPRDAGAAEKMAQLMFAETRMALLRNPEAIGWYGEKLAQSKRVAAILHPEISPVNPFSGARSNIYDPLAEHAWDLAMAITSNGMAVTENAKYANAQYENWRDTGFFIEEGVGDQGSGMKAAFRLYNTMKRSMSEEQIMDFLAQKMTVGQLKKSPVVKAVGINIGSSESVNTEINGSYIFGPKIGQGFFQNLRGNFDPLTMDLWFMRLFNRISGRPFAEVSDKTIRDNTERLIKAANSDTATEYERSVLNSAMKANDIDVITPENSGDLAVTINNMYQRDFRLSYNRAIKESGLDKKSPEAKAIGKEARPKKTELFLAAQRFSDNLELTPQDAPRGSADRTFMRDVVDRVRMALADDGVDITTADIQAVLWYAEKQLYASMGVTGGKGADNDYVDGAIELLRSKGIDDAETIRALSDADRVRLYRRTASARSAGGVRDGGDTADGQVEDGGGSGGVSGEAVRGGSEEAVVDGDKGRLKRKYSRRPTAGAMSTKTKKKVQANQSALMYARSADTIAKGLQLGRYGLDERRARQFVDGILRRFQDSMLPVGRMIQELSAKGMNIVDAMDTYLQEEIMSRKTGALIDKNAKDLYEPMVALVKKLNVPAQRIDQLKRASTSAAGQKGFVERAIEQYGSSKMALAEAYLYARHAKERNRYILENRDDQNTKGSGMSDAEADAILRWFEALDPANKKIVADIGKYARLIVANTNQTRVEGGLISRDVVNAEEGDVNQGTSYGFYVPLRGIINEDLASVDDAQYMPPATPRYGARGKEDRTALGRAEYASDILANLMTQNQNAIVRAERNKVGQSFLSLLRADPTMTESYAKILPTPPKIRDTVNGKIVMRTDQNAYKRPDILVVKEDGKETFVQFDDLSLAGALNGQNGFGPERGGALLRGMSMVNRYLASINTSYNPAFIITNVFRDSITGLVNLNQFEIKGLSSEVAKNILPSIKGIAGAVLRGDTTSPWAKVYADFVENGGQNATNSFDTLEERVNDLRGLLSEISDAGIKSQWSRMKNSFVGQKGASLLNTVESINTAAENGIRVATYKALLDRGFTKERAAQAAGNVTVNFSKGGDYRRLMNGLFLFYNASIQGTFAMLNAATRSKKVQALWVGIMAAGFVNDMFNAMMSGEDDDGKLIYDKAQDYVLENNIILPDFLGAGERSYISIPMPYGLNMAYNTGRSVSRFMRGKYSVSDATSSIFGTAVDVLNPIGSGDAFLDLNTAAPTIADPIVDLLSNEDFAGRNIYKEALGFDRTPEPASQRYWSTTSPSAVWIAKNLNSLFGGNEVRPGPLDVSPDVIQFWFEFLTGGVGRFVQQSGESIARVGTGDFGEGFIENFPVFNRIVRTVSEREDMGSYIEGAERVLTAEAELKRAREVGDQQWAQRTIQRYGAELRIVGQIRSAETALRRLSRQRGEIESNPRIPEAQKAVMLDRIEERRQQVLARANAVLSSLD